MAFSRPKSAAWAVVAAGLFCAVGCARWLPAPVPMRSLVYQQPAKARCLVVLLPGVGDGDETFEQQGFISALHARPLSLDLVAANATLGYYAKGILVDRLAADVVDPMLSRGYRRVWFIGTSLGGLGALLYSREHPGQVAGILALAPYLGEDSLLREIKDAGGLPEWKAPPKAPLTDDDYQRQLWGWLQQLTSGAAQGPDLYLGWGSEDKRVGAADALLAQSLAPEHVFHTAGGHDWPEWRALLAQFLDRSDFAKDCAAMPGETNR